MSGRAREAIAPLYLLCCLLFGGLQNSWGVMVLQLLGLALLAWSGLDRVGEPLCTAARQLLMIAGAALVVIALQLVPLPLSLWQHLGGRQALATDYRILGLRISTLPLSLTPYETLGAVLNLIPPLAMVCAIVRLRAYRSTWLLAALLAGTAAYVVLYVIHVPRSDLAAPPSGFASHVSILAAASLPFVAALLGRADGALRQQKARAMAILAFTVLITLTAGAFNRSLVAIGLALSVLVGGLVLFRTGWRHSGLFVAGALIAAVAVFISMAAIHRQDHGHVATPWIEGSAGVLRTTAHAIGDFMPFGSGLGSFEDVYRLYENADRLTSENVAHAPDDYLELALEMGLPGILLLIGFLSWWRVASVRVWRSVDAAPYARAASITSALILVDSLADLPFRTAEIGIVFAMCLGLMADHRTRSQSELWPTRHVVLE